MTVDHDDDVVVEPREIAAGVFWIGKCQVRERKGQMLHSGRSMYLIAGEDASALVECGLQNPSNLTEMQIEQVLALGLPPLKYVFLTHTETPHGAGVGLLLDRYPDLIACGCVEDLHLAFPEVADDRFRPLNPGDELDLGGTKLKVVEAVIRDMARTRWVFETRHRMLFPGDGFAYGHHHKASQCGKLAEEVPELDLPKMTAYFNDVALVWMHVTEMEPYVQRLDKLIFDELDAQFIGPTHGLPIGNPAATMPAIRDGLRLKLR